MKLLPVVGPNKNCVNPIFEIGPLEPRYSEYIVFEVYALDGLAAPTPVPSRPAPSR